MERVPLKQNKNIFLSSFFFIIFILHKSLPIAYCRADDFGSETACSLFFTTRTCSNAMFPMNSQVKLKNKNWIFQIFLVFISSSTLKPRKCNSIKKHTAHEMKYVNFQMTDFIPISKWFRSKVSITSCGFSIIKITD